MYKGYIAAIVTPFSGDKIDFNSFESYINYISNSKLSGFVVCGSTGESLSLSENEKIESVKKASEINRGKIKIIAGVIDSATSNCYEFMKKTEKYVDAFLCICPFYVKPSQEQIVKHFATLAESTEKDIILYNNPGRVGTSIGFDALRRLTEISNVKAIKECASDLSVFSLLKPKIKNDFNFLSGNDDSACGAFAMGAEGVVSVSANVAPGLCSEMYESFCAGDPEKFARLRDQLSPLHKLMFTEPSPGPVKYALSKLGLMKNELRMPLSPITSSLQKEIYEVMRSLNIHG